MDDIQLSERIFYDYLKKTYDAFMSTGVEIDSEMDTELIKSFGTSLLKKFCSLGIVFVK